MKVGKVVGAPIFVELDDNTVEVVPVDFWGTEVKRPDNFLNLLASDSPEALLVEQPEALAPWAEEAPLKLVALALSVDGGTGKVADIRAKLDERVLQAGKWESWWKKQPQQMRKLPACFRITKVGRDSEYRLLTYYDSVPAAGELKKAGTVVDPGKGGPTTEDWRKWLQAHTHEPSPGRFPTRQVATSFANWPANTVEQALLRMIVSAEEALASEGASPQVAEGWLRAIAQAALRWRETGGQDTRGYLAARVGDALARLASIAGDRAPQELLLQAGAMDGATDAWRRGFAAGMWDAFDGDDARNMYLRSAGTLGRQARGDLAREMVLAAFGPDFSERRHPELDRLLDALPESERTQLLEEAMARASASQRAEVLEYVANSRQATGPERLGLRLTAMLILADGHGDFAERTSWELADALAGPDVYGPEIQAVLEETATRVVGIVALKDAEMAGLREAHEAQMESERQEQERLRQQVRERNAELAANREESRLELRQDMLLAVGEVLQSVCLRGSGGDGLAADAQAGLVLALGAGGAEPVGSAGDVVPFDPEKHRAEGAVSSSGLVRIIAPGVIYRGGIHGDRVLLKAHVKHEAG